MFPAGVDTAVVVGGATPEFVSDVVSEYSGRAKACVDKFSSVDGSSSEGALFNSLKLLSISFRFLISCAFSGEFGLGSNFARFAGGSFSSKISNFLRFSSKFWDLAEWA